MDCLELSAPITANDIRAWISKDPVLSCVHKYVMCGWPNHVNDISLKLIFSRKDELSIQEGCILWGSGVVVPPQVHQLC